MIELLKSTFRDVEHTKVKIFFSIPETAKQSGTHQPGNAIQCLKMKNVMLLK